MALEHIHIQGKFEGYFRPDNAKPVLGATFNELDWRFFAVDEYQIIPEYYPDEQKVHDFHYSSKISDVRIRLPFAMEEFEGELINVVVRNLTLHGAMDTPEGKLVKVTGDVWGSAIKKVKPVKPIVVKDNSFKGLFIRGWKGVPDFFSSNNNQINFGGNALGSWSRWLPNLLWLLLGIFFLFKLPLLGIILLVAWALNKFGLLGGTGLNTSAQSSGCLGNIWNIILVAWSFWLAKQFWAAHDWWWLFVLVGGFLFWIFSKSGRAANWMRWVGMIAFPLLLLYLTFKDVPIELPKPTQDDGKVKLQIEPIRDSLGVDSSYNHTIDWKSFNNKQYQASYSTFARVFQQSFGNGARISRYAAENSQSSYEAYGKIYQSMANYDSPKIDSLMNVLNEKGEGLNAVDKAEMVITFIQEIPYVLVHDLSCKDFLRENRSNSFVVQYHAKGDPCLANVPAGVQSPYSFAHNLKGDCDTRSLLGYLILKKMGIPASVWVSEAYGHSILGVGLPAGTSNSKTYRGIKYYGTELTAKGFRIGQVHSSNGDMDNWEIVLD